MISRPSFGYVWRNAQDVWPDDSADHSIVVHMAAQAESPLGFESPRHTLTHNVEGTVAILEAVRRSLLARPGK